MHSLLQARDEADALGLEMKAECVLSRTSDADIAMCRNALLGAFLISPCTDLLFVDADISWGRGDFTRLMSHDVEFVAGIYRRKRDKEEYTVIWPEQKAMGAGNLLEAEGCGFGFVHLTRDGLSRTIQALQPRFFRDPAFPEIKCPWLFEFFWDDRAKQGEQAQTRLSEDYRFCQRWREGGGKVWVDPMIFVDHTGSKVFEGNVIEHLRSETYRAISAA
jgi:hypothetical protein